MRKSVIQIGSGEPTMRLNPAMTARSAPRALSSIRRLPAARIWACTDAVKYAGAIERAHAFLATLQTPSGGLRYRPGSDDVNTWATIFAQSTGGRSCAWKSYF